MAENISGWTFIVIAILGLTYATLGRVYRFHRSCNRQGRGRLTLTGELSFFALLGFVGGVLLHPSAVWVVVALCAGIVAYLSQNRANRRHEASENELRERNALNHPGVFDDHPPSDIDAINGEQVDLYDAGACTYIGSFPKSDIKAIISAFSDMQDQGRNDIFILVESLEFVPSSQVTPELTSSLNVALEKRDHLVLRWMPESRIAV